MALLAAAGLLRPEAWVLAGLVLAVVPARAATCARGSRCSRSSSLAPLCWALVDLAVTGDPLYSLHATSKLAEELGRVRGVEQRAAARS